MNRRHRALLLVSWLASLAPALSLVETSAHADEVAPVIVEVATSLGHLDENELRRAIGAELRAPAIRPADGDASKARGTILIGLDRASGDLLMTFRPRSGQPLMRKLKLPVDRESQINTIALLAGNLARDEASELLSGLRKPASASASASASAPEPPPSASASASASAPDPPASASASAPIPAVSGSTPEPPAAPGPPACSRRFEKSFPVSLQALPGVGFPLSSDHQANVALSFVGSVGEVRRGIHLGALLAHTRGDVSWASVGGLGSVVGGKLEGVSIGGLFHAGGCDVEGAVWGGVAAYQRGNTRGAMGAGLVSLSRGSVYGMQVAGLGTYASGKVTGLQASSLANVAWGGVSGLQAGLVNLAGDVYGAQIGLVNVGGHVRGTQIGLVNVASHMDGFPLGLFSWAGNTRIQAVLWASAQPRYNLGVKFTTGHVYQMFSLSQGDDGDPIYGLAYSLGLHFPIGEFFVDGDVTYQSVVTDRARFSFDVRTDKGGAQPWALKLRLLGGFQPFRHLGVFAGGGATVQMSDLQREVRPEVRQEWSVGVQF